MQRIDVHRAWPMLLLGFCLSGAVAAGTAGSAAIREGAVSRAVGLSVLSTEQGQRYTELGFELDWNRLPEDLVNVGATLACWGRNDRGQATPPAGTFLEVSAGNAAACAVRMEGSRVCWGGAVSRAFFRRSE